MLRRDVPHLLPRSAAVRERPECRRPPPERGEPAASTLHVRPPVRATGAHRSIGHRFAERSAVRMIRSLVESTSRLPRPSESYERMSRRSAALRPRSGALT
eukprot:3158884-Prymnesium_polylepis.1